MSQMKWWGWGDEEVAFTHEDKPELGPFIERSHRHARRRPRLAPGRLRRARRPRAGPRARPARRARGGRRRRPRLGRRPGPRRPRARQEPARPRPPPRAATSAACPTSSSAPAARPELEAIMRAALDADAVADPVRRRHEHLRQPRGPGRRGPHGRLGRHGPAWTASSRSTTTSRIARIQAGAFGPALEEQLNAPRLDHRPLPRQLQPLDARRLDRDPLVGHAVRQVRRRRRPHARACASSRRPACSSRARCPTTSTGPSVREMVLGSEGRLGIITRGDGARAPRPRASA